MEYRREIDGLRALAVLPVIWFHAGISAFGGGFVGVDVFFVISGYLITSVLLAELEQGTLTLPGFYERRARRILPALFLVMLVCLPFAWYWLLPIDMKEFSQSLVAVPVFASNIYFWFKSGYFSTASEYRPLIHTWSLAVEEQYYVLFPMVLMLVWKRGQRWILCALGMVFLASMAAAQWAVDSAPDFAFYQLPTRIWELLMGVFAAFYLSQARTTHRHTLCRVTQDLGGWTGLALLVYAIFFFSKATPFPGLFALVPTGGALLVILFATKETTVGRLLGNRAFVGIGLVSYSAYLWHQPLFAFARLRSMDEFGQLEFLMLSVLTFVLAYFSWKYVETPFRRTGFMTGRKFFSLGLAFALFFVLVGFLGHITHGFEDRFERALPSDIGRMKFYAYIDEHFFDCEPKPVRQDFFRPS
jgi:peptidoglycan/LPS O-acetylase OafA/YrhL